VRAIEKANFIIAKPYTQTSASIFEEILIFSATTCTKKNGSEATLGTLGAKKSKFTKKTPPAKNDSCTFLLRYLKKWYNLL